MLGPEERLRPQERSYREILGDRDPEVASAHALAKEFGRLIREHDGAGLAPWLKRATDSGLPEFQAFVRVLDRDRVACVFRRNPISDSDGIRSGIPMEFDQPVRAAASE